jgi:hypothetical protein
MIQEAIPSGKKAVFLWAIQARPKMVLEVRPTTSRAAGVISKYQKYAKSKPNFREFCGVGEQVETAKALFIFLGFADDVKAFRSKWYGNFITRKVIRKFGSLYTFPELRSQIPDRTLRFQVNLSFDTLDVEAIEIRELESYISSPANISALMRNIHENNHSAIFSIY